MCYMTDDVQVLRDIWYLLCTTDSVYVLHDMCAMMAIPDKLA